MGVDTLLLIALFLPLAGALLLPGHRGTARAGALLVALAVLAIVAVLVAYYPGGIEPFALTDFAWLARRRPRSMSASASGSTG